MPISIGLLFPGPKAKKTHRIVEEISKSFGYSVANELDDEIVPGIMRMLGQADIDTTMVLGDQKEIDVNVSSSIQDEMDTLNETEYLQGNFSRFLKELEIVLTEENTNCFVFFCVEWHASDRIRYSYGTAEVLSNMLARPENWTQWFFSPEDNAVVESMDLPFVFKIDPLVKQQA